jgi:multiple sugar transport system permease protein
VPAASVAVELLLGTALALALSRPLPGRRALRTLILLPYALPEIVFLLTMRYVLAPRGYANGALAAVGLPALDWLEPGSWLSYATVILVDAWHVTPLVYLMVLAALRRIPEEVLDAARLDGARRGRQIVYVIVPLLAPTLRAALLLRGLDALRIFAAPLVLTGVEGVPVLSTYAYHQWADYGSDPIAAAAAVVLALLCVVVSAPLLRRPPR